MTKVIFNKNAGRFRKGQAVDFPPALADFFVSKVRCADKEVQLEKDEQKEDFSDVLSAEPVREEPRKNQYDQKKRRYTRSRLNTYETADLKASK